MKYNSRDVISFIFTGNVVVDDDAALKHIKKWINMQ
jgi:hypothetical protein